MPREHRICLWSFAVLLPEQLLFFLGLAL